MYVGSFVVLDLFGKVGLDFFEFGGCFGLLFGIGDVMVGVGRCSKCFFEGCLGVVLVFLVV